MTKNNWPVMHIKIKPKESFIDRLSKLPSHASEWSVRKTSTVHNHCIMPMHKSGYTVVTDPDMLRFMGKKP